MRTLRHVAGNALGHELRPDGTRKYGSTYFKEEMMAVKNQRGLAFVWILMLLALISALSISFLNKVGIGTAATVTRGAAMRTQYLARSGANHALWRLLNEPGFPASENVYYMHDLADGRYGYKVRKPTLTTFASVATVGAVGDVVTRQSYIQYIKSENILITYDPDESAIPRYRQLLGADWTNPTDTVNDGSGGTVWMVLRGAPTRKEFMMGTFDNDEHINLAVWNSAGWGNLKEFTQNTGGGDKCFDIAYESQSGDALMVGRFAGSTDIKYMGWNGSGWVPDVPTPAFNLDSGELEFITMASNPHSDEILIAAVNRDAELKLVQWDGAVFNDLGVIDNDMHHEYNGSADIVYEQQSGHAVILWSHEDTRRIYYSIWNGSTLSPVAQAPDFGGYPIMIRAAADPASDYIVVAAIDNRNDVNVAVWDGDTWIDSMQLETDAYNPWTQSVDVAWELSGDQVIVAWARAYSTRVRYFTWKKGTSLSDHGVQIGPSSQFWLRQVRLHPVSGTQKVILIAENVYTQLRYSMWTGSSFLGDPSVMLDPDLWTGWLLFEIAESGVAYTGGSG